MTPTTPQRPKSRFNCPACGFAVFNRRLPGCESCGAALPAEFLFTPKDLGVLDAEQARNDKVRAELKRQADELEKKRVQRRGGGG
jgi:predicted RNA-binding Zn-ribbon protein involved in translation (DUF1610 family)